jgi:hypothetical protein
LGRVQQAGQDRHAELAGLFGTSAQVLAGLLVALALLQAGGSAVTAHRARRFLSVWTFPLLGIGIASSVAGLIESFPTEAYPWLFAITVGVGVSTLACTLAVGVENLRAQRDAGLITHVTELGAKPQPPAGDAPATTPTKTPGTD